MTEAQIVEAFLDAVCDGGTPVATCDLCGRTWYHPHGEYMEDDGEFEGLQERHKKEPEKCLPAEHAVSIGYIFGRQHVWDCRCEGTRTLALRLSDNSAKVLRFYQKVAETTKAEADALQTALNQIPT